MDPLARAVEAADSVWPVIAIAIIGLYALLWKFGNQLLKHLIEAKAEVKNVTASIQTNHGSPNLGASIDHITEVVWEIRADQVEHIAQTNARLDALEKQRS